MILPLLKFDTEIFISSNFLIDLISPPLAFSKKPIWPSWFSLFHICFLVINLYFYIYYFCLLFTAFTFNLLILF